MIRSASKRIVRRYLRASIREEQSYRRMILAGRIDDLINSLKKKNPKLERDIDYLVKNDPTGRQKHLAWSVLQLKNREKPQEILKSVKKFEDLLKKNQIPTDKKDLSKRKFPTLNSLTTLVTEIEGQKSESQKKREDRDKVYAETDFIKLPKPLKDRFVITIPKTEKASCYIGRGTKWCTSGKVDNQFDKYGLKDNITLYYVIDKSRESGKGGDPLAKVAFALYPEGKKFEIFNANDRDLSLSQLPKEFQDLYKKYIKPHHSKLGQSAARQYRKEQTQKVFSGIAKAKGIAKENILSWVKTRKKTQVGYRFYGYHKGNPEDDIDFKDLDLRGFNFENADLDSVGFENSNLKGANFRNCGLADVDFENADLEDADLSGSNCSGSTFEGANLTRVNLQKAKLYRVSFEGSDLSYANLSKSVFGEDPSLEGSIFEGANLSEVNLSEVNLSGADLSGIRLAGVNFSGANLNRADISGANLMGANLNKADLRKADLNKADISEADISEADLMGANLEGANLNKTNIEGANLEGANLEGANLEGASLSGTFLNSTTILKNTRLTFVNFKDSDFFEFKKNLDSVDFSYASFKGLTLSDIDFNGANLTGSNFTGAIFKRGVYFKGSKLDGANFSGSILRHAHLTEVNFSGVNFSGANLNRADLYEADLSGANLSGADLSKAVLYEASLKGANLSGADLEGADLNGVKYDDLTLWPEGFDLSFLG